ncbi:MAG: hypothetical protein HKN51_12845, partial [Saprospiraceae bacterium]|nr:hypothetical protein [Saprospiraceae bacterium]
MRNLTPFFFLFLFCWSMTGRASGMPPSEMTHIDCPPTVACIGDGIVIEDYLPWADIIIPGV